MVLRFPNTWRLESPNPEGMAPPAVDELLGLAFKVATQGYRQGIIEHFKSATAAAAGVGDGLMLLSSYEKAQEEEADWLSGSLLLPREALASIKRRRLDAESACLEYGISSRMLQYRMSMTGINRQYA